VKFDTEDLSQIPLSACEFHENRCRESHILLMEISEILNVISIFLF